MANPPRYLDPSNIGNRGALAAGMRQPGAGADRAPSCPGGSCGTGRRRKARTWPYGLATAAGAIGTITLSNANVANNIPSGSKLRLSGTVAAGATTVDSVTVDGVQVNIGKGISAQALDVVATGGFPLDFILPAITKSVEVKLTGTVAAGTVVAYLENVPPSAINNCGVVDDGAEAQADG